MTGKTCRRCGHVNRSEANFCSACGIDLRDELTTLEHTVITIEESEKIELDNTTRCLVIVEGHRSGTTYTLEEGAIQVGRGAKSTIFLDDVTVSRNHAQVKVEGEDVVLSDAGSLNGTYLNGKRVEKAKLKHKDDIQIGKYKFRYLNK